MSIQVMTNEQSCQLKELAFHHQTDPFPGGILFHIDITGNEAALLVKRIRREVRTHDTTSYYPDAHGELDFVLFDFLRKLQESSPVRQYVLNRVVKAELDAQSCRFDVEASPVVR